MQGCKAVIWRSRVSLEFSGFEPDAGETTERPGSCFYCPNIPEQRGGNRTHKGLTDIQTVTCAIKTDSRGWTENDQGWRTKLNGFVYLLGGQ